MTDLVQTPVERLHLPPRTGLLRRMAKHPRLMHHHRLIAAVIVTNLAVGVHGAREGWFRSQEAALAATSWAVLVNFALAILIRQQYVVNLLFWLATRAPTRWPLRVRWTLGKVYHFGGVYVGARDRRHALVHRQRRVHHGCRAGRR